jgi:hypothetical protein
VSSTSARVRDAVLLTAVLAVPSLFTIETRLHLGAVPIYVAYVAAAVWLWRSPLGARLERALGERRARVLALLTLAALVAFFAVVYPIANSGRMGLGSDADDALNQATRALLEGRYPYREKTYLGNEITPMPGELMLAVPFVLLGNGAYQTFLWLVAGALLLRACWRGDSARALTFCWLVLATSAALAHQIATGGDYVANALMVLVFTVLLVSEDARLGDGARLLAAVALGVSLSSRANFAFVVPLVGSRLVQTRGLRRGLGLMALVVAAACAVTLPFLLHDPAAFSPLHTRTKLAALDHVVPHLELLLPLAAGVLALVLSRPRWNGDTAALLRNATVVQALLVLGPALAWLTLGQRPLTLYTAFGPLFMFFGLGSFAAAEPKRPLD